jgi:serine/threonine-protein kinase RsbW
MNYRYKVKCKKNKLKEIREFVTGVLQSCALTEIEINKMVLAVDEVCANLIIHSYNCDPKETIELSIDVEKDCITFEIIDRGLGFNICNYKEPTLTEVVKEKKKGGIGLMLVRRIMDDIEFRRETGQSVCKLSKKINPS